MPATTVVKRALEPITVPIHIFTAQLSPLETVVKYLHEGHTMRLSDISRLLGRDVSSVWLAYRNAARKYPAPFIIKSSADDIPIGELKTNLGILESICLFLREQRQLRYREISTLLHRDDKTIWTTCQRAMHKTGVSA